MFAFFVAVKALATKKHLLENDKDTKPWFYVLFSGDKACLPSREKSTGRI